jgi:hypothetical protein
MQKYQPIVGTNIKIWGRNYKLLDSTTLKLLNAEVINLLLEQISNV